MTRNAGHLLVNDHLISSDRSFHHSIFLFRFFRPFPPLLREPSCLYMSFPSNLSHVPWPVPILINVLDLFPTIFNVPFYVPICAMYNVKQFKVFKLLFFIRFVQISLFVWSNTHVPFLVPMLNVQLHKPISLIANQMKLISLIYHIQFWMWHF